MTLVSLKFKEIEMFWKSIYIIRHELQKEE